MSNPAETQTSGTQTVVVERSFAHPPEKLWRALTQSHLLGQWLMNNDFEPTPQHKFQFRTDPVPQWDGIVSGEVLFIDPIQRLSYTWSTMGLDTVVLFILTPIEGGTHLRMEHSGFPLENRAAYQGATYGWQKFLGNLETVLDREPA